MGPVGRRERALGHARLVPSSTGAMWFWFDSFVRNNIVLCSVVIIIKRSMATYFSVTYSSKIMDVTIWTLKQNNIQSKVVMSQNIRSSHWTIKSI